mmetsp:Transcript_39693/g.92946  ORF Transcript_39693/g.92946 Transcript_39693/m.92946 type:complete len:123 (+) Transcript_39693:240-608(+)
MPNIPKRGFHESFTPAHSCGSFPPSSTSLHHAYIGSIKVEEPTATQKHLGKLLILPPFDGESQIYHKLLKLGNEPVERLAGDVGEFVDIDGHLHIIFMARECSRFADEGGLAVETINEGAKP